MLLPLML